MDEQPMTAAELRTRAISLLAPTYTTPTPEAVARADVWARLALSASISEASETAAPRAAGGVQ